jgi:hypothetical protein
MKSQTDAQKADEEKRIAEQTAERAKSNSVYAQGKQPEHHMEAPAHVPTNVDGWLGNEAMNVIKEHWTDPGMPGSGIDAHIRSQKELEQKEQDRGTQQGQRQGRQGAY